MADVADVDAAGAETVRGSGPITLAISARWVWLILNVGVGLLLIAHICGQYSAEILGHPNLLGFVPRFNMNNDPSVPAFFAASLLLTTAAMLALTTLAAYQSRHRGVLGWVGLTLLFLFLAVDEAAAIHELINVPLRRALGIARGWLYFAWVIPYTVAVVIFALVYLPFIRALPRPTQRGLVAGALLLAVGALGLELIESWYRTAHGYDFGYWLLVAVEETLEMEGVIVLLCTFIAHYARTYADARLRFLAG